MNIAIIPARKNSKGVPNKNIRHLGGKPLIAYAIEGALESKMFDEIFVSTDSIEVADIADSYGIKPPFLRPDKFATDSSPMLDVIKNVINYYEDKGILATSYCLLQPTAPFRTANDIKNAYQIFNKLNYDSVIAVKEVPHHYNPCWTYVQEGEYLRLFNGDAEPISRRQELPNAYVREGSIYIFKPTNIKDYNNLYGDKIGDYLVEHPTVNIDTMEDFEEAQRLIKLMNDQVT